MPDSQSDLRDDVRALTNYDSNALSQADLDQLIGIAQKEIRSDVGDFELSFFGAETDNLDQALFWLTCLFTKVKAGELDASTFTLGELRNQPLDAQSSFWMSRYEKRAHAVDSNRGYGSTTVSRDDRDYEFDTP